MTGGPVQRRLAALAVLVLLGLLVPAAASGAPALSITQPQAGASINDATPSFAGTSADTSDVVTLRIYEGTDTGSTQVQSEEALPSPSEETWATTASEKLDDGAYTVVAEQVNSLLETTKSEPISFTVDTRAPAVTITSPANNSVVHVTRPTFAGAGGGAAGDDASVVLKVYEGTDTTGAPEQSLSLAISSGKWTSGSSGPQLPNGLYTAVVEQSDKAGNTEAKAAVFLVSTNSPTVTLQPVGMVQRGEASYSDPTPAFSGEAGHEPEDEGSVTLKIYKGTSASGSPLLSVPGPVSGSHWAVGLTSGLAGGTYTAQAEQKNETLPSGVSAPLTFTVDADAPHVSLSSPANGSSVTGPTVHVGGGAGTSEGDSATVTAALYEGSSSAGQPVETVGVTATGDSWSTSFGGLSPGTYTTRAQQRDDVGNVGMSAAVTFTVPQPPLTLLGAGLVERGKQPVMSATPSFNGTAPGSANVVLKLYAGGTPVGVLESPVSGSRWSAGPVAPPLPDGSYAARATQVEDARTASSELKFTVDADAPHVTLSSPANGSTTASSSEPVNGTAGTAPGDASTVTAQLFSGSEVGSQSPLESITVTVALGLVVDDLRRAQSGHVHGPCPAGRRCRQPRHELAGHLHGRRAGSAPGRHRAPRSGGSRRRRRWANRSRSSRPRSTRAPRSRHTAGRSRRPDHSCPAKPC